MLPQELQNLLRAEQVATHVVHGVDIDEYIHKIGERAEILAHFENGCSGFVAYYCNNPETKQAFITMVIVNPDARGRGIGKSLIQSVLGVMRGRGFLTCSLEVCKTNVTAHKLYSGLGFVLANEKADSYILSFDLTQLYY